VFYVTLLPLSHLLFYIFRNLIQDALQTYKSELWDDTGSNSPFQCLFVHFFFLLIHTHRWHECWMLSAPASYQHDMRLRTANQISCTVHVFTGMHSFLGCAETHRPKGVSSYVLCALIHSQMMQGRKDHHDLGLIVATAEIPLQIVSSKYA
jgi:hypothetical protein